MSAETVAVMFTDLVGSTDLLSRVGHAEAEALRRVQFQLVQRAVTESDGRTVKNLGDGLMAAFALPTAALDAAVEIQRRLEVRNRRAEERLDVRIGVSFGEAESADDDYFGTPVIEAARLCALAMAGQVLATDVVRVVAGPRTRHDLEPLGAKELKGLHTPVEVCEVRWVPMSAADATGVPLPARLLRPPGAPFVGRDGPQSVLTERLKASIATSRRQIVLVGGEAGIGKTTLLAEFAARAHEDGAIVTYGRCDEDLSIPYQPWREILAQFDAHVPEVLDEQREALAMLLGASRVAPRRLDADSARFVLYGAVVDTLARASTTVPVVVLLEDLHWADAPTLALLRYVAQSPAALHLLVVATFRDAELRSDHPMSVLLGAMRREAEIERLTLRGFDDVELLDLLETLAGHEMDEQGLALRDSLRAETDGNPFFATEILRHLAETGAITQRGDGQWRAATDLRAHGLPVSVREVIGLRVTRLGDDTRRALRSGAVIGREFDLDLLAELLGADVGATYELLVPAVESAVLTDVAPGRFSFTHALIGHALYDELTPTARARAHQAVAETLECRIGDEPGPRAAELAHHWSQAIGPRDARKASSYARHAADYALGQLAPDEAVRWYTRALELIDETDELLGCELLVALGEAQRQAGNAEYRATLLNACRRAIALDADDLLVRATLANNRGLVSEFGSVDEDRVAMIRAAIAARPVGEEGALLHALLAAELQNRDREGALRAAEHALALAREFGSDRTFARVAGWVLTVRFPGSFAEHNELFEEARAADARLSDPLLHVAIVHKGLAALERGDLETHDRYLEDATRTVERVPEPYFRWTIEFSTSTRKLLSGDIAGSEHMATVALERGLASGQPEALRFYAAQLFEIRRAQGRLNEVLSVLEQTVRDNAEFAPFRAGLAAALCDLDRLDDARHVIYADGADGFVQYPLDITWTTSMLLLAEVSNRLSSRPAAEVLTERLQPWRDWVAYSSLTCDGSLARGLGLSLATLGRRDAAVDAFEQALEVNRHLAAPILVARTEVDLACTLREVDRDRARRLASNAARTATELGLGTIARRSRELLIELA